MAQLLASHLTKKGKDFRLGRPGPRHGTKCCCIVQPMGYHTPNRPRSSKQSAAADPLEATQEKVKNNLKT